MLTLVLRNDGETESILQFTPCSPRKEVFKWLSGALQNHKCVNHLASREDSRGLQPTGQLKSLPEDVLPITPRIAVVADAAALNESRITDVPYQHGYIWGRGSDGKGNSVATESTAITAERHGVENPLWRKQIAEGSNATTPFTGRREAVSMVAGDCGYSFPMGEEVWFDREVGHYPVPRGGSPMSSDLASSAEAGALKKLHRYILSTQQSADVGESLAEYSQAVRMIGRPMAGLRDLLERTERRAQYNAKFAAWVGASKNRKQMERRIEKYRLANPEEKEAAIVAGKLYLEFKFGWEPLARDLHGALVELVESQLKRLKKQKRFSFKTDLSLNNEALVVPGLNYFRYDMSSTETHVATVRYIVGFKADDADLREKLSYLKRIGVSPQRFVPTLYAVIPYSWLLDYITALNDVIDALFADLTAVAWVCRTDRYERLLSVTYALNSAETLATLGGVGSITGSNPFTSSFKETVVSRTIPDGLVPDVQFNVSKTLNNPGRLKILAALILSKVKYPSLFKRVL